MSILKIGISSRALFDLGESHEIFKKEGIEEYSNYQKKNENKPLDKGVAFNLVEKLLQMNNKKEKLVEVNSDRLPLVLGLGGNNTQELLAMFDWFKQYPEEEWYDIFTELTPNYLDDTQRKSWFEDQFYAPYEQSVTFADLHQSCKLSGSKIISTSIEDGIDFKQKTVDKLNNKEFTSGFIYTLFDKNPTRDIDEELLKQRIDDIRTNDPYIYR